MVTFRQNALNNISSAEELDKTIVIIGSRIWLTIGTITVLAVLFLSWSVLARITSTIQAPGLFLPHDGIIVNVTSSNPGTIKDIYVKVGDIIEKDGLVAELTSSRNERNLEHARTQLTSESALLRRISDNIDSRTQQRKKIRKEQIIRLDDQIEFLREEVANNKKILDERVIAFAERNITVGALAVARNSYFSSGQQLDALLSSKAETRFSDVQIEQQDEVRLEQIKQNIQGHEATVENLTKALKSTQIYAPIAGRIIEIKNIKGSNILPDQAIANLVSSQSQYYARAEKNLEFVAYVNIANGKKIKIGSEVNVAVNGFDKNNYGFIKGIVTNISNFPVSGAGILSKLGNRNLINDFTRQVSVYEIKVRLLQHSESKNRLLWSSDQGREIDNIEIGTLGNAEFILEKTPPISKAIPALKKLFD